MQCSGLAGGNFGGMHLFQSGPEKENGEQKMQRSKRALS